MTNFLLRQVSENKLILQSSRTSSGWLKAIHQVSIDLSITDPEFLVSLCLWLGISLFPLSPLCVPLSTIAIVVTIFLNVLMGLCASIDMMLVNIVYHALSQSHPGVLKEQRVSGDDHSRLGDIYNPDFQHGCPAYLDISVSSTTQASHISSSSSCTGVTAAAGELAKEERHRDIVKDVVCNFIPFVVKTFDVWSSFALQVLYSIADHTTARNGASTQELATTTASVTLVQQHQNDFKILGFAVWRH